jgi:hypothetical protein
MYLNICFLVNYYITHYKSCVWRHIVQTLHLIHSTHNGDAAPQKQHSTFTVQILYKLYSVQLNCAYSNYTETPATCSAAQQHNTFTVQILYKLHSLKLNCTYSNYTEAAATCSAAQQHTNYQEDVFWSAMQTAVWNYIDIYIQRLDPSNSRYWLQRAVSQFDSNIGKLMLQRCLP